MLLYRVLNILALKPFNISIGLAHLWYVLPLHGLTHKNLPAPPHPPMQNESLCFQADIPGEAVSEAERQRVRFGRSRVSAGKAKRTGSHFIIDQIVQTIPNLSIDISSHSCRNSFTEVFVPHRCHQSLNICFCCGKAENSLISRVYG